ncbi:hypothetical protein MMC28_011609, partial [Mycoblastus sanguinarius]|nr:hypothetical protein [Mycoblastus sanguinarius]
MAYNSSAFDGPIDLDQFNNDALQNGGQRVEDTIPANSSSPAPTDMQMQNILLQANQYRYAASGGAYHLPHPQQYPLPPPPPPPPPAPVH